MHNYNRKNSFIEASSCRLYVIFKKTVVQVSWYRQVEKYHYFSYRAYIMLVVTLLLLCKEKNITDPSPVCGRHFRRPYVT